MRLRGRSLSLSSKPSSIFALLLAMLCTTYSPRLLAQQAYTNADVIKMVQGHLGASVIIEQIRSNPGNYLLTPNSLIRLHQAGVPDEVIHAMQERKSIETGSRATSGDERAPSIERPGREQKGPTTNGKWEVVNSANSLTGREGGYLRLANIAGSPSGRFEVRASCNGDTLFTFTFASLTRGGGFSRSVVPNTYKAMGAGQPGSQCAHISVAVGSADPIGYYSQYCDSDDQASVAFVGPGAFRKSTEATQNFLTATAPNPALATAVNTYLSALTAAAAPHVSQMAETMGSGFQMQHVINGDPLAVQLPFKAGGASTIRLNLRDPVFSNYVSACIAEAHKPEVDELVRQGNAYDAQGAYTKAEQTYSKALSLDPNNKAATDGLAKTKADYDDLRRRYNAEQAANAAASGQQACTQGDYATAIKSYTKALELDNTNQAARQALSVARQKQAIIEKQQAEDAPRGWWQDPVQHLMWTRKDNGTDLRWKQAEKYCSELRLGGFADWRMPTLQELKLIYDPSLSRQTEPIPRDGYVYHPGFRREVWPKGSVWVYHVRGDIQLSALDVWSATERTDDKAFPTNTFDFSRNQSSRDNSTIGDVHRALCVRPIPAGESPSCSSLPAQAAQR